MVGVNISMINKLAESRDSQSWRVTVMYCNEHYQWHRQSPTHRVRLEQGYKKPEPEPDLKFFEQLPYNNLAGYPVRTKFLKLKSGSG